MRFNGPSGEIKNAWRWSLHPNDPDYEDRPTDEQVAEGERELDDYLMREIDDDSQKSNW